MSLYFSSNNKLILKDFLIISPTSMIKLQNAKPHFFQPLIPDFDSNFSIPKAFLKYLGREKEEKNKVTLRNKSGRSWEVKVDDDNKLQFKHGWNKFCVENGLNVGGFLVFRLVGCWVFDVLIFDPTGCERQFSPFESLIQEIKPSPSSSNHEAYGSLKKEVKERQRREVEFKPTGKHPYCHLVIKRYSLRSSMYLPLEFARKNGLRKECTVTLQDIKGRPWPMKFSPSNSRSPYFRGWAPFQKAHNLKPGDQFILELIHSGSHPVFKLHV